MSKIKTIIIFVLALCAASCRDGQDKVSDTFTLSSGISLRELDGEACDRKPQKTKVLKRNDTYVIEANVFFPCQSEIKAPYLTMPQDGKSTLVIDSEKAYGHCECQKNISIDITNRLQAGDTVYILINQEVAGHVVLP